MLKILCTRFSSKSGLWRKFNWIPTVSNIQSLLLWAPASANAEAEAIRIRTSTERPSENKNASQQTGAAVSCVPRRPVSMCKQNASVWSYRAFAPAKAELSFEASTEFRCGCTNCHCWCESSSLCSKHSSACKFCPQSTSSVTFATLVVPQPQTICESLKVESRCRATRRGNPSIAIPVNVQRAKIVMIVARSCFRSIPGHFNRTTFFHAK